MYEIIEDCSYGPFIELFSRTEREGWTMWGNQTGLLDDEDSSHKYGEKPRLLLPESVENQMQLFEKNGGYKLGLKE